MTRRINAFENIRIIPRTDDFLDRKIGEKGEIFYSRDTNSLRVYDGSVTGGFKIARADLTNITNSDFLAKATAAGVSGGGGGSVNLDSLTDVTISSPSNGQVLKYNGSAWVNGTDSTGAGGGGEASNSFETITVSGQSNVVADSSTDTLTLVAGTGISITTDPSTDSITITNSAPSGNSFSTIAVSGQSNVVAASSSDTLTVAAGSGISITTNSGTDTITITSTVSAGSTTFSGLTDATSASLTVDEFYLPAITKLVVSNSGTSAYLFDQYTGNNPTIYAISGTTIAFSITSTGHPFLIQDPTGNNYNTGLIHVSTTGTVTTGTDAQGKTSGTLYWKIPSSISGTYRYQCASHAPMVGGISVKAIAGI